MKRDLSLQFVWVHDTHIEDNCIILCDDIPSEIIKHNFEEYILPLEKLMSLYHFCHKRYGDFE